MIDFTDMPIRKKAYAGANGGKIAVMYEGEQYMLKFPPHPKRNKEMSYTHSLAAFLSILALIFLISWAFPRSKRCLASTE